MIVFITPTDIRECPINEDSCPLSEVREILVLENKMLEILDEVYLIKTNSYNSLLSKVVLKSSRLFSIDFSRYIQMYET
jgi:hypothetical protein